MATYVSEDEVVYDPSFAKTQAEYKEITKHNERAKTLRAARREQERINEPTFVEKCINGIINMVRRAKAKQNEQSQQKSR